MWVQTHNTDPNGSNSRNLCLQPIQGRVGVGTMVKYTLHVNGSFRSNTIVTNHLNATGGQLTYSGSTNSISYYDIVGHYIVYMTTDVPMVRSPVVVLVVIIGQK